MGAPTAREDLLELIDDRAERRAIIIAAPLPTEPRHGWIGNATIADPSTVGACITPID